MSRAFMSIHKGISTYFEDMTLYANFELGDLGTCRRR
jgi:hypothetical protein